MLNTASNVLDSLGAVKYGAGARINKTGRVPLILSISMGRREGFGLRVENHHKEDKPNMFHHLPSTKKKIIGRTFNGASKTSISSIEVQCVEGNFTVSVQGDCCSSSVFYDLVIPTECIGEQIIDVIEGQQGAPILSESEVYKLGWGDGSFDYASIWDVQLVTKSGAILLRHANDSNGYYDGETSYDFA